MIPDGTSEPTTASWQAESHRSRNRPRREVRGAVCDLMIQAFAVPSSVTVRAPGFASSLGCAGDVRARGSTRKVKGSHVTQRWRKEDSNSQSHLNKKLSEGARSVPPASGDPPASLTPSGGRSVVKSGFP